MTDKIDIEAVLRASLNEHARHAPAAGMLAERVIGEVDLLPPARERPRARQWRTWSLPLVAAGSVAAVAAALVGITQVHHSADHKPPAVPISSSVPAPTPTATGPATNSPNPTTSPPAHPAVAGPPGGPVPTAFAPASATFISTHEGWLLGQAKCLTGPGRCTAVLRSTDGAQSWAGIPAPLAPVPGGLDTATPASIAGIRFADALNGWAFGGALYATHDGGRTWAQQHLAGATGGVAALETADGSVYALVEQCFGALACQHALSLYRSPIGANNWSRVLGPLNNSPGAGFKPGRLYVHHSDWWVSAGNSLYHGSAATAPVTLTVSCVGGSRVAAIAVADRDHLDAVCEGGGAAGSAEQQLLGTVDGGRHWAKAGPSFIGPTGVAGIADNGSGVLLVASSSGGSIITRTANDGASFSTVLNPANTGGAPWNDLGFTTTTQAFAVLAGSGFYLSHDAGLIWTAHIFH